MSGQRPPGGVPRKLGQGAGCGEMRQEARGGARPPGSPERQPRICPPGPGVHTSAEESDAYDDSADFFYACPVANTPQQSFPKQAALPTWSVGSYSLPVGDSGAQEVLRKQGCI